jgi:predicted alpha/beta-fold hydrolase
MHFRGCSGEINRLPRSYHSGETGDAAFLIRSLRERYPDRKLAAIGYSLGANVLLKYLGECGADAQLHSAVAISVPFLVRDSAERLNRGFSRFYQKLLLQSLMAKTEAKFDRMSGPVSLTRLADCRNLREFDDCITAPLHGFADAADYYARSSCRQYLRGIAVPTLVVNARNDPFMTPTALPTASELSAFVRIELTRGGGHVGFVTGRHPGAPRYWLEERIPAFLSGHLA